MPTDFPESSQLIGNDITEGDFKVAIDQFLAATKERVGDTGSVSDAIADVRAVAESKQSKLTAGEGISISGSTISATVTPIVEPYAIGSYAVAGYLQTVNKNSSISVSAGTTKSGASLFFGAYASGSATYGSVTPTLTYFRIAIDSTYGEAKTGTWKLMHRIKCENTGSVNASFPFTGLWQRIA